MSERRTRKYIGRIQTVHYWPNSEVPHQMRAVADSPVNPGDYFFNGTTVFFSDEDKHLKKEVIYEACQQIQRTTRGVSKLKLRVPK